jgi:K+-sensing histidine kinase KdpD
MNAIEPATLSHDLRNPLCAILSSTELLECYSDVLSEDKKKELLREIKQAIEKVIDLLKLDGF